VALLGNSMGCQIAGETAVRHPGRVSHVVLQGPAPDPHVRSLLTHLVRLVALGPREPPSLGPVELVDWLRAGLRYTVASVRSSMRYPIEERLPLVSCPALVVRGQRDRLVPLGWARRAAALLPHGELRVIPGAAHAMVYANALELARATDAFLQAHGLAERTGRS
jgi:2-hydroxy-6-oxonona-2,4-dienedioate hydrolase